MITICSLSPQESLSKFVIPAKSACGGREPGSRRDSILLNFHWIPHYFAQGGESFDVAQDREPVEPRISPAKADLSGMTGSGAKK